MTMTQIVNMSDISALYPDEWLLFGNPDMDEKTQRIMSGILLYHGRDKKEVCYLGKPLTAGYDKTALIFNRTTPRRKRSVIATLFYPVNQ
jgi:hypothetical protein